MRTRCWPGGQRLAYASSRPAYTPACNVESAAGIAGFVCVTGSPWQPPLGLGAASTGCRPEDLLAARRRSEVYAQCRVSTRSRRAHSQRQLRRLQGSSYSLATDVSHDAGDPHRERCCLNDAERDEREPGICAVGVRKNRPWSDVRRKQHLSMFAIAARFILQGHAQRYRQQIAAHEHPDAGDQ